MVSGALLGGWAEGGSCGWLLGVFMCVWVVCMVLAWVGTCGGESFGLCWVLTWFQQLSLGPMLLWGVYAFYSLGRALLQVLSIVLVATS